MEKISFPKNYKVYLPLIALFLLVVFTMPKSSKFNYDYRKGSPWMYETLISQFDFPVLKTDAQIQEEREKAGSAVIPYYRMDAKIPVKGSYAVSALDLGECSPAVPVIAEAVSAIYSKGVVSQSVNQSLEELQQNPESIIYVQKDRRAMKVPFSEVFTVSGATLYLRNALILSCPQYDADSLIMAAGLSALIEPSLIYDQQTTDLINEEAVKYISSTLGVVRAGQVLVSEGEMVTAEIEQLLNSYKTEYDMSVGYDGPEILQWTGNMLVAFCMVFVLFLAICYCNYRIFEEYNKYLYLLMIFALAAVASSIVARVDSGLFYLMPFTLISLYLLAFFTKRMVFSVYFISLLPMLVFAPDGVELFMIYLVAGSVAMLVFGFFNRGWLQFVTALIVFAVMTAVWMAFRLVDGAGGLHDYHTVLDMGLGALLSVAGYPLIFLFEKMFNLVSNSKLAELSDTNNKLLRQLADKAPGTFQHSLQVMNLADAAARSIGANVLLVRAGALYHDIGKLANPQCFTENANPGVNYHEGLSLKESAQEIIRHVSDGLALAEKHGLPHVIQDFISSHHGTSCTGYFYTKYLNDGGNPDEVSEFFYTGKRPVTKEQVVLMICDSVEAASRSLKNYSPESISALVDKIVEVKASENQFDESNISLHELNILKEEIKSYLQQMYHSRVSYPKRKVKAGK